MLLLLLALAFLANYYPETELMTLIFFFLPRMAVGIRNVCGLLCRST